MNSNQYQCAHLRKVLDVIFPSSYIRIYHKSPNFVCSLMNVRCWTNENNQDYKYEASSEPTSRASLISLREHFNQSLKEHQAKPVGLCSMRRAIYDQCFDELIRQVTISCVEQGLLLFRIRNELRMTINCYRKAYESGVKFGLNKAICAELKLNSQQTKLDQLETLQEELMTECKLRDRKSELELKNKLESVDRMKEYYKNEIIKRDQAIEQQRVIIKALSQKSLNEIRSPI